MGVAKDINPLKVSHTKTGVALGSLLYMAPEQLEAKSVTFAADRYSLGLIAYQLISGKLPWGQLENLDKVLLRKFTCEFQLLEGKSLGWQFAVFGLLFFNPEERWVSCEEFLIHVENDELTSEVLDFVIEKGRECGKVLGLNQLVLDQYTKIDLKVLKKLLMNFI